MNSKQVKAFLTTRLFLPVRVRTIPCKAKWIDASVEGKWEGNHFKLSSEFPESFRRICMKTVYPNSPVGDQQAGGNIGKGSISMLPHEWQQAIETYERTFLTKTETPTHPANGSAGVVAS